MLLIKIYHYFSTTRSIMKNPSVCRIVSTSTDDPRFHTNHIYFHFSTIQQHRIQMVFLAQLKALF